jgi:hypothetical protein
MSTTNEATLLLQEEKYSIWKFNGVPEEAIKIFDKTNWGSAGAVYVRKNSNELVRLLKRPYLFAVKEGDQIVGTAIFCHTHPFVLGQSFNCYIIRYFAATEAVRGKKIIKYYSGKVMEVVREGETEKTIYVGCVENGNIRSYKVVESAGYEKLGLIKVNAFSRFFPKQKESIQRIKSEDEKKEVRTLLTRFYEKHVLVHFDYLFLNDNYFVIRENGEIVVGCQFHHVHWAINNMPGLMGKIIMNVLPKLPMISKMFNPKRYEFLAFEGIYFKEGYIHKLFELLEGLLHREKRNSSLFWMGEGCPYLNAILNHGKLGIMHSFVKNSGVYIMTSYRNMNEQEILNLKSGPLYGSAFDFI